jgi:hypothetical protein
LLNNVYTDGYTTGYYYGNAKYASIRNSWFRDVSYGLAYAGGSPVTSDVSNVFIKTKRSAYSSGVILQNNTTLRLSNSIIHISSNRAGRSETTADFISGSPNEGKITATGNIFICDIDPLKSLLAATTNTDSGVATSKDRWSNNVYILLKGNNMFWSVSNPLQTGAI